MPSWSSTRHSPSAILAEDGSLWVSLDDHEAHYFKVMCDEIFGRPNFVGNVIWQKIFSPKNTARHFSEDHDHIFVYAKNADIWVPNQMPRSEKLNASYKNPDNDPRGPWTSGDLSARNFYGAGTYPINCPSGRIVAGPPNGMYWRVSKEKFAEMDADNRIWWGADGNNTPRIKRFLAEVKQGVVPQTLWMHSDVGNTQEAKKEVVALFGSDNFMTPKPERLLARVLHIATNPGDLVLDSFAGSGTTGAVAHKMGRRWIMIELGDHCETLIVPRLNKVIDGEDPGGVIDNRAALIRNALASPDEETRREVLFVWKQIQDAPGKEVGQRSPDRGIIQSIDGVARAVTP